jgi:hypothetical protein
MGVKYKYIKSLFQIYYDHYVIYYKLLATTILRLTQLQGIPMQYFSCLENIQINIYNFRSLLIRDFKTETMIILH